MPALAVVASLGMLLAACGGGSKKATNVAGATSTTEDLSATTTTATPGQTSNESTTTTAAVVTNGTTATTTKAATSTGSKATTTTVKRTTSGANQPTGGITNVTAAPTTTPAADIQPGGTITFLKGSDPLGYDPINLNANTGADAPTSIAVFGALVYSDPADGIVKPYMADGLTSTDGLTWILHLRSGIKFSDGTAFDANAVKFNWLRLQDVNNHAQRAAQANLISAMTATDANTLQITLKAKNAIFPQTVALIPYIGSPAAITSKGTNGFNSDPVGAGPFLLKSWQRDSQTIFTRNPTYWDAPRPYVDQLVMKPVLDEGQRANTLLSGAANMLFTVTPQTADQLKKGGAVEYAATQNGGPNLLFNMRAGSVFADLRARKAVTEAIDRADLAKTVLNGAVEFEDSIFRHNSPYYDANILQPGYNPTEAQQLFDQLANEQGGTFKFTLTNFITGNFPNEGQYIQSKLNSYRNVKVELVAEATNLHITNHNTGNFQAEIFSNPFDDPEPTWTSVYLSTNPASPTGWNNKTFDNLVADNQLTLDGNKRIQDLKDAQKEFYKDIPGFYFERRVTWNFGVTNIKDVQFVNDGTLLWDRLWIKSR